MPITAILAGLLAATAAAEGTAPEPCVKEHIHPGVNLEGQRLSRLYKGIRPGNHPVFMLGTGERAIIIFHGFMASPFEVFKLGQYLNKRGWTVYLPLIRGFGASDDIANLSGIADWRETVADAVRLMGKCYAEIDLAGFSLGGALAADYVLNPPPLTYPPERTSVRNLVLLSPYFRPSSKAANFLTHVPDESVPGALVPLGVVDPLKKNRDLTALREIPEYYNNNIPLKASGRVLRMQKIFANMPSTRKSGVPVFLQVSAADATVDAGYAERFVSERFSAAKLNRYEEKEEIPHQLAIPKYNPRSEELFGSIAVFLDGKDEKDR